MTALLKRQTCVFKPSVAFNGDHIAGTDAAVETDPSQRYLRYPVLLGKGACKRVYKAFDQEEGIEVAWNQVDLGSNMDPEARERLFSEIHVLKTLKHRNIMTFHDWWFDANNQTINFITEYFTSGNLRQYRKKHKHISEQAIKRWAFQILEGLLYLHAHDPPIVHRDLKCDNILVNGTSGQVKIADLGLASCQRGLSVVGTPEFMAPEMYDEVYDEKVDIYSFGMCMLELATLEYPYSECRSIPAIFRKVSQGIPPASLAKVSSQSLRDFITLCINSCPEKRPQALQLLKHEFFNCLKPDGSANSSPTHASVKGGCFSPPFGSCGNLQALTSGGSHVRSLRTAAGVSFGEGSSTSDMACTRASAGLAAGLQAAGTCAGCQQQEAAGKSHRSRRSSSSSSSSRQSDAGASSSAPQPPQQAEMQPAPGAAGSGSTAADKAAAGRAQRMNWQSLEDNTQKASCFARGTTMCLGLVLGGKRPKTVSAESAEDSDDEVLVELEDVLAPHPEDLLDPETYHLHSQLTHAGDGCAIMSGPNCPIAGALESGLPLTLLSPRSGSTCGAPANAAEDADAFGGLLSRSVSVADAQRHQQQQQQQQSLPQQPLQQQQRSVQAASISVPPAALCDSPRLASRQCLAALLPEDGAACPASKSTDGQPAAAAPVTAVACCRAGSNSSAQAGGWSSKGNRRSSSCDTTPCRTPGSFLPGYRPSQSAAGASGNSILSASAPLVSFKSEAAALAAHVGTPADASGATLPHLLRTISSGNHRRHAGALAAAGLLQMSPGLFVTTPALLGKLLSKKVGLSQQGSLAAAGVCHQGRVASNDSLGSWEASLPSFTCMSDDQQQQQQQQQQPPSSSMSAGCRASSCGALLVGALDALHIGAAGGSRACAVDRPSPAGLAAAAVSSLGVLGASGAEQAEGSEMLDSDRPHSAVDCIAQLAVSGTAEGDASGAAGAAVPGAWCAAGGALNRLAGNATVGSAAASPVGGVGFGKILVRRKFARNLHPVMVAVKRSNSV